MLVHPEEEMAKHLLKTYQNCENRKKKMKSQGKAYPQANIIK